MAKAEQREKKAERKRAAKAKREAQKAEVMAKRLAIKAAIRSLGKCCGVWRRHHKRRAFCSKCGSSIVLPKL